MITDQQSQMICFGFKTIWEHRDIMRWKVCWKQNCVWHCINIYIYIYIYITTTFFFSCYLSLTLNIYIYIYREREREREKEKLCMHVCIIILKSCWITWWESISSLILSHYLYQSSITPGRNSKLYRVQKDMVYIAPCWSAKTSASMCKRPSENITCEFVFTSQTAPSMFFHLTCIVCKMGDKRP